MSEPRRTSLPQGPHPSASAPLDQQVQWWREFGDLELLYRDGPCFVVNKPGGLLTQAPPHLDSVERRAKETIRRLEGKTGRVYLGVPHRIDRPASGALVLARHARAARRLARQFAERTVEKLYHAWLEGDVRPDADRWQDWMRKIPGEAASECVAADHPDAREAVLEYRVLRRESQRTLVEIRLITGRTHQIRLQASARGWPIAGDHQYGASSRFGPSETELRRRWIALHAARIAFTHPMTKEPVAVDAPWRWANGPFEVT